jgi:DNA-binding NarL/FixJ family response regulator
MRQSEDGSIRRSNVSEREQSVLLVDDDSMVRGWVRLALEDSEFRIAGEAATATEAVELVQRRHPDVLLIDYNLQDGNGAELIRDLRQQGLKTPAVVMTANPRRGFNEAARDAGAQGSVLKTGRIDELLSALRAVVRGHLAFDARHPVRPAGRGTLSPREREVLRLVAAGAETVKTLLSRTFAKLGVKRRAEAVAAAHKLGLL